MLIFTPSGYIIVHYTYHMQPSITVKNIRSLGPREAEFLSIMSERGGHFVHSEAVEFWGSAQMASKKLCLLRKKMWLARVERGKYMVIPLEAGVERVWSGDPYVVASSLVRPAAIAYRTAISYWRWTEGRGVPFYIQTTSRKKSAGRNLLGVQYEYVTVPPSKFFGHSAESRSGRTVLVTDREKTLIDAADDVERAGGVNEVVRAVRVGAAEISWQKLGEYGLRFPNRSALKRLGYLFEAEVPSLTGEARQMLEGWRAHLSAGVVPLQPGPAPGGRIVTRWRVRINSEPPY